MTVTPASHPADGMAGQVLATAVPQLLLWVPTAHCWVPAEVLSAGESKQPQWTESFVFFLAFGTNSDYRNQLL